MGKKGSVGILFWISYTLGSEVREYLFDCLEEIQELSSSLLAPCNAF